MTKEMNDFENAVKPFYIPSKDCYIAYSENNELSVKTSLFHLTKQQVKTNFGFNLLCENLTSSVKETEYYRDENKLVSKMLTSLRDIDDYLVEKNTLNLFILYQASPKMGFGIATYSALKKGMVIAEYIGERKASNIKLDDTSYVFLNSDGTNIDAKDYGNVARFFNHCPLEHPNKQVLTANLGVLTWPASKDLNKVFFFTIRDIKPFEPLCWDYGDQYSFGSNVELLNANTYLPMTDHGDF